MDLIIKTPKDLFKTTVYYQRQDFAYYLNPNVDWTKLEIQSAWARYGRRVGRFLTKEYPLTRDELAVLCRAYAI